ncbi:methyl-CpG-binding domain protein 1b isoform X2 [Boleophthalmus pectinirostris]|uniref:methyl-CpG-binding domain protein 1b isoform X2 n=1 Tax=Boleophthalmus pectinirostris TaxID=150288 RepID=UPI00242DC66A|nr:methyl-CpG-binding domain protein 1b isoform X2 [Boleophthalmus pectinirostris]
MEEEQPKTPAHEGEENADKQQGKPLPETDTQATFTDTKAEAEEKSEETKEPTDWFEPLEDDDDDDDANSFEFSTEQRALGHKDPEEESLAGESERSGSVAGSEKARRICKRPRRKRTNVDEGWEDCPSLGEGWKRKESVRQSGTRSGQSDIYYMSPQGERARSRIELSIMLNRDLSCFEFKTGVFHKNGQQRLTLQRRKRKPREHSSSDSSFVERGEGADTPDSHHRLTPTVSSIPAAIPSSKTATNNPTKPQIKNEITASSPKDETMKPPDGKIKLPGPTSSKPLSFPSINGEFGPEDSFLVCSRCGLTFTGTWYDKQRKRPLCPSCWALKTKEHPLIRFRKWIPCGQCAGCHNKVNCGQCSNCKERRPESRKRTCRKRKCLCPIRKGPGGFVMPKPKIDAPDSTDIPYYQHLNIKNSDTENLMNLELDEDDDVSTDDDEDRKRRKRRSCGECPACLYSTDCGTCDFCIDKPKFGGSNKKRQKCRLRQCQRQAMRHLLPSQLGSEADGISIVGRPKPQYTYSRKRKRAPLSEDEDDDDRNQQAIWSTENTSCSKITYKQNLRKHPSMQLYEEQNGVFVRDHNSDDNVYLMESRSQVTSNFQIQGDAEEEDYPTITQIYSLTDEPEPGDLNQEHDLMKLLNSLRSSALPILWYAIMAEGPQLQLVQCSKQSVMADTTVQIDTDFNYKISVQRHPLLPTHPLYDAYPSRLNSVTQVVNLLLDMDKYIVCHGVPPIEAVLNRTPVILERAPTCEFLIKKNETICRNCRVLCE